MGRLMTGGGEGPSVAEVAASLPARLLGAMKEQKSSENLNEEGGERDLFLLKFKEKLILSLSAQSSFYRLKIA